MRALIFLKIPMTSKNVRNGVTDGQCLGDVVEVPSHLVFLGTAQLALFNSFSKKLQEMHHSAGLPFRPATEGLVF